MRKPLASQVEKSKLARMKRRADAYYASPEGKRMLAVCAAFSAKWRRELAELEAQKGISSSFPKTAPEG